MVLPNVMECTTELPNLFLFWEYIYFRNKLHLWDFTGKCYGTVDVFRAVSVSDQKWGKCRT